jgi:hypothetical protein
MDPDSDPGGPKTFGSYGSGSATLLETDTNQLTNYRKGKFPFYSFSEFLSPMVDEI